MIINILTLEGSEQRQKALIPRLEEQGVQYEWNYGIIDKMIPFAGISRSHKSIVRKARSRKDKMCCIAEDDIVFTAPGAWQHFLNNMPEDFDLYLGGISNGHIALNNTCKDFRGLFLYIIHERFYDTFLEIQEKQNIDAELANKGKYIVCNPFAAIHADGYSHHHGAKKTYGHLWEGRKLYGMLSKGMTAEYCEELKKILSSEELKSSEKLSLIIAFINKNYVYKENYDYLLNMLNFKK